jgi:hypothetical protein
MDRWFGLARQIKALSLSPFVRQSVRVFIVKHNRADLAVLKELVEAGKSRRSSTGATPCVKSLKPSVIRGKDTLGGRSSSRSEMQAAAQMAASPLAWPERSVNCAALGGCRFARDATIPAGSDVAPASMGKRDCPHPPALGTSRFRISRKAAARVGREMGSIGGPSDR